MQTTTRYIFHYDPEHGSFFARSCSCVVPGYVGKWKRHWFVLNDAVLYYFLAPQHQDEAPRCIIPLEGINISPIGATDLSIGLRVRHAELTSRASWAWRASAIAKTIGAA